MYSSKTKLKRFIVFSLILSVAISPMLIFRQSIDVSAATTIEQDKSSVTNMNKQLALKKQQIAQAEKEIIALKNNQSSYTVLKTKLDEKISLIEESIEIYTEMLKFQNEDISELQKKVDEAQAKYDARYAMFLEMMRVTYENGNAGYIEMIVNSENLSDFLYKVDILSDVIEYNKNILGDLKKSKEENQIIIAEYQNAMSENLNYQQQQKEKIEEVKAEKKEADRAIATIERDIQKKIELQETITRDMNNAQAEIQRKLNEIAQKQRESQAAPKQYVGGVLQWPVDSTRVTSGFGNRTSPITGRSEFHYGIDISASGGSSIYAANDGTVLIATYNSSYGNYVVLEHGGGMTTLYAHSSQLMVKAGDTVKKGAVIAKVGSTGASTGNHLHFEVSESGARKNPLNYFK